MYGEGRVQQYFMKGTLVMVFGLLTFLQENTHVPSTGDAHRLPAHGIQLSAPAFLCDLQQSLCQVPDAASQSRDLALKRQVNLPLYPNRWATAGNVGRWQ